MSKGSSTRPGTGYSDGWDRVFAKSKLPPCNCLPHVCMSGVAFDPETCEQPKREDHVWTGTFTFQPAGVVIPPDCQVVKSSAIHCADDMAAKAERMIEALCLYEVETTWDDLNESMRSLHSAIYEYRKRMEK